MRRNDFDCLLQVMLASQREVSDLNFTVDKPLQVESDGELVSVPVDPPFDRLSPYQTETIALILMQGNRRLMEALIRTGSCDCSYALSDQARFRVNIFSQRGQYSIVMRKLNTRIPTLDELKLPEIFRQIAREKTGLILITGATGSGKTTTLAALLNEINDNKSVHVITLEDPVEFVHPQKRATFNHRELGTDFDTFANGLRAALRQAPKVILVGEMRDRDTVSVGLAAAETGHLVLSTLHTIDAGQTINRILGMYDQEEQKQIRLRLADTLRWVVSQRLAPMHRGGRTPVLEIMGSNLRTQEAIVLGESEGKTFYDIIESSYPFGWRSFDHSCVEAYEQGIVTEETALLYCSKRGPVTRMIDNLKKQRGEFAAKAGRLHMRPEATPGQPAPPTTPPSILKLK